MGQYADRADSLADTVGANEPGAANHLYQAAAILREGARRRAEEYAGLPRDGKKT
jgi:hypothetical protein